jgi:hypothetical protein
MRAPKYVKLVYDRPSKDDIRFLLKEMVSIGVSEETAKLFGTLARTPPAQRLAQGCAKTIVLMADRLIRSVLEDGLFPDESAALLELDDRNFSFRSRCAAHMLLCIKQRWFLSKSVRGFFHRDREAGTEFLDVGGG